VHGAVDADGSVQRRRAGRRVVAAALRDFLIAMGGRAVVRPRTYVVDGHPNGTVV